MKLEICWTSLVLIVIGIQRDTRLGNGNRRVFWDPGVLASRLRNMYKRECTLVR